MDTKRIALAIMDAIPGGKADGASPSDFDPEALAQGVEVEMEHTDDPALAQEISMDHLTESGEYYDALKDMEAELESGPLKMGEDPETHVFVDLPGLSITIRKIASRVVS